MTLKVYQVAPAPAGTAAWIERLLVPVVEAARLELAPPIEFRSTGRWRGWSAARSMARDGRVALSNLMLFRSSLELVDISTPSACWCAWRRRSSLRDSRLTNLTRRTLSMRSHLPEPFVFVDGSPCREGCGHRSLCSLSMLIRSVLAFGSAPLRLPLSSLHPPGTGY